VKWELDHVYDPQPIAKEHELEADDRELFDKVSLMKDPEWPEDVQLQYAETLAAINRMRISNNRKTIAP